VSVPLLLLLLAPFAGIVLAITFAEAPSQRRVLVGISSLAMLGGAVAGLVRTAAAEAVSWRGFGADAWTALLALAAVASIVAGIARAGRVSNAGWTEAALFASAAAGVVPLLVPNVHLLAVTLPVSTLAFVCTSVVVSRGFPTGIRILRPVATLALSDLLVLLGLGTAISTGTRLPPELSTTAAALVLAGAAIRLGLVPLSWGSDDATSGSPILASVWLGPIRAQGFLLVPFALGAGRGLAYAAAAVAAATALVGAALALRRPSLGSISSVGTAVAVLGLALGGPAGLWGATLAIAATFALIPAWYARDGARELAGPTAGALPAGALLPGTVLVATAAFDAASVRPGFLAFAVPVTLAAMALGATVVAAAGRSGGVRTRRGVAAAVFGGLSIAAVTAIAAVPQRVMHGLAFPVADALGVGRLLRVGFEPGITDELAVIMIGAAALAFLTGPGPLGSGGAPAARRIDPPEVSVPVPRVVLGLLEHARAWTVAGAVLLAASVGIAIRIYVVAARRGFL
jgi:hypothetical protein